MVKNTQLLYGLGILLLLGILTGGYFAFIAHKSNSSVTQTSSGSKEETINTLNPDDIGLQLQSRNDHKAVKFAATKTDGITSIDYEITYIASGNIPRGVIGHIDAKSGQSTIESQFIDLGTCSSGHCKYDEGVSSVKFVLKVTKTDNKIYQVEKKIDLTQ